MEHHVNMQTMPNISNANLTPTHYPTAIVEEKTDNGSERFVIDKNKRIVYQLSGVTNDYLINPVLSPYSFSTIKPDRFNITTLVTPISQRRQGIVDAIDYIDSFYHLNCRNYRQRNMSSNEYERRLQQCV